MGGKEGTVAQSGRKRGREKVNLGRALKIQGGRPSMKGEKEGWGEYSAGVKIWKSGSGQVDHFRNFHELMEGEGEGETKLGIGVFASKRKMESERCEHTRPSRMTRGKRRLDGGGREKGKS